ncbi:MAG: BCD family MFS transporter [Ardenticatenaceae bacterium]
MAHNSSSPSGFSLLRTLKLGSFHIGSAFTDILVSGVWNRILISNLGVSATPVAFLAALRYFIAPLTIWIGHRSDTTALLGYRRLSYIYLGRLLTWLSLPLLPLVIFELATDQSSLVGWGLALVIFLLYGLGTLISGAPFLALVRESAPPAKQGLAIVMVQTVLLFGFAVVPISYAILMKEYTPAGFWRLVGLAMLGAALTWLFSVWGEERRNIDTPRSKSAAKAQIPPTEGLTKEHTSVASPDFMGMMRTILAQPNTRTFFFLLSFGAIALFAQDAILEPFGGDLFGLDVGTTTRFNAYYGTGVLLAMIIGSILTRRWLPQQYTGVTAVGLLGIIVSLGMLVVAALAHIEALLVPTLFAFGITSGIYTVGGLNLMIAMTDEEQAGTYLGLWTMAQLVFRGVGISLGGLVLDVGSALTGWQAFGYAAVFAIEMLAALIALILLIRLKRLGYLYTPHATPPEKKNILAMAAD